MLNFFLVKVGLYSIISHTLKYLKTIGRYKLDVYLKFPKMANDTNFNDCVQR